MVYGSIGRTGVYQAQRLLRIINSAELGVDKELLVAGKVLQYLPNNNWFKRAEELSNDHIKYGASGTYDLLLHKRDISFSINQVSDWIAKENLNVVNFVNISLNANM